MATPNPFDRFDAPQTSAAVQANPFDKFDDASYIPTYTGLARNTIAGTNEGIATVAGAPVDAMTWGLNKGVFRELIRSPVAMRFQKYKVRSAVLTASNAAWKLSALRTRTR